MIPVVILYELMPLIAAVVGVLVTLAIPALRRRLPRAVRLPRSSRPDSAARIVLGAAAVASILLTVPAVRRSLYGLGRNRGDYWWWMYSEVLILACLALLVVAVLLACFRRRSEEPVAPSHPRTWRSFTSASQLWLLSASVFALFLFVTFAGSASSPDEEGRYRMLEIETGRDGGAMAEFFGWAYGVPVALLAAVLTALTITALHLNAARPFLKPATARGEERSRSTLSALLVGVAVGVVLVTLARAMSTVAGGAGLSLSTQGYSWETTLAALSPWLYWLALLLRVVAYMVLLLVVVVAFRRADPGASPSRPAPRDAGAPSADSQGTEARG